MNKSPLIFEKLLQKTFLYYLFICSFLPSGTIFHFNIKLFLFVIILALFLPVFLKTKVNKNHLTIILFISLMLFTYMLLGLLKGYDYLSVLVEFKFIIVIYLMLLITYIIYVRAQDKLQYLKNILTYSIYGSMSFLIIKTYFFVALLFGLYDYSYIKNIVFPAINYVPVGLSIDVGGSRFSFITLDFLSIIIFIFYLYFKKNILYLKFPTIVKIIYPIALAISIFSAYSRFLFVLSPFLLLLTYFLNREYKKIIIFFIISLFVTLYFYYDIHLIVEQRFLNQGNSDSWRILMIHALIDSWAQSPFFGNGIGAYSFELIRDKSMLFTYEVQFVSLLMQFGVFFILINAILLFFFLGNILNKTIFLTFIIFMMLMFASMTNQYLLSSTTGVLYVLILVIMLIFNKKNFVHTNNRRLA
jgi:hypothetical protein